jgi:hypothetical protein
MARGSIGDDKIWDTLLANTTIEVTIFNLVAIPVLPGYLHMRSFFSVHLMGTSCAALLLPPAHSLLQWTVSTPIFM